MNIKLHIIFAIKQHPCIYFASIILPTVVKLSLCDFISTFNAAFKCTEYLTIQIMFALLQFSVEILKKQTDSFKDKWNLTTSMPDPCLKMGVGKREGAEL